MPLSNGPINARPGDILLSVSVVCGCCGLVAYAQTTDGLNDPERVSRLVKEAENHWIAIGWSHWTAFDVGWTCTLCTKGLKRKLMGNHDLICRVTR